MERNSSVRLTRVVAIGILSLLGIQMVPDASLHLVTPAAAASGPATAFGGSGDRVWDTYDLNSDPGTAAALLGGLCGCEPTLGVDWVHGNGKDMLYQAYGTTVCGTWNDAVPIGVKPPGTFTDCTSPFNNILPNADPILYTDFDAGQTFAGGLYVAAAAGCSDLSITLTNDGSDGWSPVTDACSLPTWDHETIASGPWAYPVPIQALPGSRAVYYCSQLGTIACWVSYDNGMTFLPFNGNVDPSAGACVGLHGHMRVTRISEGDLIDASASDAEDDMGVIYLPDKNCGGMTGFMMSRDNSLSWSLFVRPDPNPPAPYTPSPAIVLRDGFFDPTVAPSLQNGWVYVGQGETDGGAGPVRYGGAYVGMSKTRGVTWEDMGVGNGAPAGTKYFNVGALASPPVKVATLGQMIAGDDERAAYGFLGSTASDVDYDSCGVPQVWDLYMAVTYDAGVTWSVDKVTTDPVQRGGIWPYGGSFPGGCRNLLDFNDIVMDKEGRVLFAYTDGCTGACTTGGGQSVGTDAAVARQRTGKGLLSAFDIPDPAPVPLDDTASSPSSGGPTTYGPAPEGVTDTGDRDGDGVYDTNDDCMGVFNPPMTEGGPQLDTDYDNLGDACDADDDGDHVMDGSDNCPLVRNADQLDADHDGAGDACQNDADGDSVMNAEDNCWLIVNLDQKDVDHDGLGDLCDADRDNDGYPNGVDAFPDDKGRWDASLLAQASDAARPAEQNHPVSAVGSSADAPSSSFVVILAAVALLLVGIVALMLLMLGRKGNS